MNDFFFLPTRLVVPISTTINQVSTWDEKQLEMKNNLWDDISSFARCRALIVQSLGHGWWKQLKFARGPNDYEQMMSSIRKSSRVMIIFVSSHTCHWVILWIYPRPTSVFHVQGFHSICFGMLSGLGVKWDSIYWIFLSVVPDSGLVGAFNHILGTIFRKNKKLPIISQLPPRSSSLLQA